MRRALLAAITVTVVAAGCSGSPTPAPAQSPSSAAETPAAATPAPSSSAAATPSASASAGGSSTTPASNCLTGSYRLDRFTGVGADNTYGAGRGGDVTLTFDDGEYELTGAGKKPGSLTIEGAQADLLIDGTTEGVYSGKGDRVDFTRGKSTGSATFTAGKDKRTVTMAQVATVLAPSGKGKLTCTSDRLTVALPKIRLELVR